jgi:glucan biosynthesis protein
MEIPTTGETLDNIVCFWQPEKAVKAGDELDFLSSVSPVVGISIRLTAPLPHWLRGSTHRLGRLLYLPTTGETLDNIVCFWQPEKAVKAGDELDFSYRLYWSGSPSG